MRKVMLMAIQVNGEFLLSDNSNNLINLFLFYRIACGIIARSAGIMENFKKLCACDGVTLWDERYKPIAGADRSQKL